MWRRAGRPSGCLCTPVQASQRRPPRNRRSSPCSVRWAIRPCNGWLLKGFVGESLLAGSSQDGWVRQDKIEWVELASGVDKRGKKTKRNRKIVRYVGKGASAGVSVASHWAPGLSQLVTIGKIGVSSNLITQLEILYKNPHQHKNVKDGTIEAVQYAAEQKASGRKKLGRSLVPGVGIAEDVARGVKKGISAMSGEAGVVRYGHAKTLWKNASEGDQLAQRAMSALLG